MMQGAAAAAELVRDIDNYFKVLGGGGGGDSEGS